MICYVTNSNGALNPCNELIKHYQMKKRPRNWIIFPYQLVNSKHKLSSLSCRQHIPGLLSSILLHYCSLLSISLEEKVALVSYFEGQLNISFSYGLLKLYISNDIRSELSAWSAKWDVEKPKCVYLPELYWIVLHDSIYAHTGSIDVGAARANYDSCSEERQEISFRIPRQASEQQLRQSEQRFQQKNCSFSYRSKGSRVPSSVYVAYHATAASNVERFLASGFRGSEEGMLRKGISRVSGNDIWEFGNGNRNGWFHSRSSGTGRE